MFVFLAKKCAVLRASLIRRLRKIRTARHAPLKRLFLQKVASIRRYRTSDSNASRTFSIAGSRRSSFGRTHHAIPVDCQLPASASARESGLRGPPLLRDAAWHQVRAHTVGERSDAPLPSVQALAAKTSSDGSQQTGVNLICFYFLEIL